MAKYINDDAKKLIGLEAKPVTWEVERGAIRRFAQAIGDPNPLFNDEQAARKTAYQGMIAPPTFCRSLLGELPDIPLQLPAATLDGGSDWEYFEPIRPGDRITVTSRLTDLREGEGRLGTMVFITIVVSYSNQFGELCVTQRMNFIKY